MIEVEKLLKLLPGIITTGTKAEMSLLQVLLSRIGISSTVVNAETGNYAKNQNFM